MASFKEIYNRKRTKEVYKENPQGVMIKGSSKGELCGGRYLTKEDISDDLYVPCKDGGYWNKCKSQPEIGSPIQYFDPPTSVKDTNIVGTSLALTTSLWEFIICHKTIWGWFKGLVTDGYAMILLSPFILAYWALVTVLYLPLFVVLSTLVVLSLVFTLVFEYPAAFMNKELDEEN